MPILAIADGNAKMTPLGGFNMAYAGFNISEKTVLITGGTLGIAEAGAKVVAGSSSPGKVEAMKKELGAAHEVLQIDVADEASVHAAVEKTVRRFGRLDAIVHAAGVIKRQPSLEMPVAEFR